MSLLNRKYLIVLAAVVVFSFIGYIAYYLFIEEQFVAARLIVDANREIIIWADSYSENCQPYYYEVKENGIAMSLMYSIGCNKDDANFKLLFSRDRKIVGVVEEERPEELLAIIDFGKGESWPREKYNDKWEEVQERGRRLRDRLKAENPQMKLMLRDEVP
jgi:hypothetical protein